MMFTDNAKDLTDEEVLAQVTRKPWLFAVLLERYQEPFLRKARSVIHNQQDAEDIVQDTFTKIYLNANRFQPQEGARFSSWAYRILMNTAFTHYQKKVKEGQRFVNIDPEFEAMIGERSLHSGFEEDADVIERILTLMPGHLAAVLRLHYLERWSHADIAAQSGEQVSTIKARVHRAKKVFRRLSEERN